MKLKVSLQRPSGPTDLVVTTDADSTVGDLALALAQRDPDAHQRTSEAGALTLAIVDGARHKLDPSLTISSSPLGSGAVIEVVGADHAESAQAARAAATVAVLQGPDVGKRIALPIGTAVIGRADGSAVTLTDSFVSREHARLHVGPGSVEVVDLGSANGISLDGVATQRAVWPSFARLALGKTVLGLEL